MILPIAEESAPSKFSAAFAFKGDCWSKTPDKANDSTPAALSVSGPALIASGGGKGEVVLEFKVTPEMKTLQFYLLGNGDRNIVSAALYLNSAEWCITGVESPKTPIAINWKLEGNAGKTARLVFSKNTDSASSYLIAAATPEALKGKDKNVPTLIMAGRGRPPQITRTVCFIVEMLCTNRESVFSVVTQVRLSLMSVHPRIIRQTFGSGLAKAILYLL